MDDYELDFDVPIVPSSSSHQNHSNNTNNNNVPQHPSATVASSNANANAIADDEDSLSPLEREVLDEYARLVGNLDDLSSILSDLASKPSAEILDALRGLERKTSTVFTLLKASVYSIVLQQEIKDG